jgi:hypothetical protein
VLDYILQPETYPELYGDLYHKVRINYYPPRGDNKEGWDNIDFFGWLGYPMQIKVDFLCRDSILAAPLALDLALFLDLAQRAGMSGIQEWLSFYFKAPQVAPGLYPEHDLFIQQTKLKNTLRWMMGEDQITHLGVEYYADDYRSEGVIDGTDVAGVDHHLAGEPLVGRFARLSRETVQIIDVDPHRVVGRDAGGCCRVPDGGPGVGRDRQHPLSITDP